MRVRTGLGLAAALLLSATAVPAGPVRAAGGVVVYRGATLVDGSGDAPRPGLTIVTRGERIVELTADRRWTPPAGAKVVDVSGLYAAPGLINTHEHLATDPDRPFAEAMLKKDVYGGVTAIRDMAGDARLLIKLKQATRAAEIPGPDIDVAAVMAGPEFFADPRPQAASRGMPVGQAPWARAITPTTDLPRAVAEAKAFGITAVKIYADLPGDEVAALAQEAHRQHLMVWAHAAVFPASPRQVIEAGVDTVSHTCMLAYQVSPTMPAAYAGRAPVDAARVKADGATMAKLFDEMRERAVILDATLLVYGEMEREGAAHPGSRPPYCGSGLAASLTGEANRAGVAISTGTDSFSDAADPWPALQDELVLLQDKAGMTPAEVLHSATVVGARAMGETDIGAIRPGNLADIVFTRDDPLKDVRAFRTVVLTVKRGTPYWRRDYVQ